MRSCSYAPAATAAGSAACRHQLLAAAVRCPRSSKHASKRFQTLSLGADTAGNAEVDELDQQQKQQQQDGIRSENYTKTRVRRLSRTWEDSSTPNTGIVGITMKSSVPGAAACVAADFKTNVSGGQMCGAQAVSCWHVCVATSEYLINCGDASCCSWSLPSLCCPGRWRPLGDMACYRCLCTCRHGVLWSQPSTIARVSEA